MLQPLVYAILLLLMYGAWRWASARHTACARNARDPACPVPAPRSVPGNVATLLVSGLERAFPGVGCAITRLFDECFPFTYELIRFLLVDCLSMELRSL